MNHRHRFRAGGPVVIAATALSLVVAGMTAAGAEAAPDRSTAADTARRQKSVEMARRHGIPVPWPATTRSSNGRGGAEVDPFLAQTPDPQDVDRAHWREVMKTKTAARNRAKAKATTRAVEPLLVQEQEPDAVRGRNDSTASAQSISPFGTASGRRPAARVLGTLADIPLTRTSTLPPVAEDNGSIPLAGPSGLAFRTAVTTSGVIGDGPHGTDGDQHGDFDFYAVRDVSAGQELSVEIATPKSRLAPLAIVWDAEGNWIADSFDDDTGDGEGAGGSSRLRFTPSAAGDLFVSVQWWASSPGDPFDSGSGLGDDSGDDNPSATGAYDLKLTLNELDVDVYAVRLRAGDVLSASVDGAAGQLSILNPSAQEVFGSAQDATHILPMASPLTGGGNAVAEHVAATTGTHYVGVSRGVGDYGLTLRAYRPGPEKAGVTQKIFLDFDGAEVDTTPFGGFGVRSLSPLSAFLGRWKIPASKQDAVIDRVVATVTENLRQDHGAEVEVLNSRDDADPFGQPDVSRLIIGGSIAESGLETIGIAESIDPGNFETEETALILLDVLSEPANGAATNSSINNYLTSKSNRVRFVGTALGNVASHEAGHYLGNWHVDQFNGVPNVMDQGGNAVVIFGVGPDGAGGTADDVDVDFGVDTLHPDEGFTGREDTANRTRWALGPRL